MVVEEERRLGNGIVAMNSILSCYGMKTQTGGYVLWIGRRVSEDFASFERGFEVSPLCRFNVRELRQELGGFGDVVGKVSREDYRLR